MRILCWNVQGLSGASDSAPTQQLVLEFSKNFPSWESSTNFHLIENGRIGLFWDTKRVTCDVLECSPQERFIGVPYSVGCFAHITLDCLGGFQLFHLPQDKRGGKAQTAYLFHDLKEFVMATSLVDALSSGSFYTWTNGSLWSKIDRVLMNPVWSDLGLMCTAELFPSEPTYDHFPVLATMVSQPQRGSRSFKFYNMWITHRDSIWETEIWGTAQYVLCGKLNLLKKPLRKLNRDEFGGIFDKTSRAKKAFKAAIILQMATPDDSAEGGG
ncbi:hypothetical protein LIER_09599 [Lithospermum erythrorhizon]|uniref:Endonuclease/exonuclease/phosphatase domain-containing protein n=1 Tax=Lithospermum erythrorhizon TaxID=34254 RepID=A0AAV3PG95_LITER